MIGSCRRAFTLIELLFVVGIMAILVSILIPIASNVRRQAIQNQLKVDPDRVELLVPGKLPMQNPVPAAVINGFQAVIGLTPRLSAGTAQPESIYEAAFRAQLEAQPKPQQDPSAESEIELPLPPQMISLGDLTFLVNGEPTSAITLRNDKLIWRGMLVPNQRTKLDVTYTAIGKGLYAVQIPPGGILDQFKIEMTAHGGSDVRMLERSLQPTSLTRSSAATTYVWDYKRLLYGRPIALDVLGIAPIDRLGELRWLGPISIIAFGIVIGLVARAYRIVNFDRWMLLLVVGLFMGAYPLMYFAQEFIALRWAMLAVGGAVLLVISIHAVSLMGLRLGLAGVTAPAAAIMALTLMAATHANLQGLLLTTLGLSLFALGMVLAPKLQSQLHAAVVTDPSPTVAF